MKRTLAILLSAALLLGALGCQHISDAYSKQEERQMLQQGRALAAAWLAEAIPDAELAEEKDTYCDIVTDYSKFYLSGYVSVPYRADGDTHTLMVDTVSGQIFSDADTQEFAALVESRLLEGFGLRPQDVADAQVKLYYSLPIHYEPTARVGKFPYSSETGFLPAVSGQDFAAWLDDTENREVLEIDAEYEVFDPARLTGFSGENVRRLEEQGLWFSWLRAYDSAFSTVDTLAEDGGFYEAQYASDPLGPFWSQHLTSIIDEYPMENGGWEIERTDYLFSDCVSLEREESGWKFTVDAPDDSFEFNLMADAALLGDIRTATQIGPDGEKQELHWVDRGDGTFLLSDANDEELFFWESFTLTMP